MKGFQKNALHGFMDNVDLPVQLSSLKTNLEQSDSSECSTVPDL
jgi:hypothetical protein